ncbi:kinesin-like protein KIF6 [Acanthaster planci]|uniref:Kinesin-like protein n=1 Tax=Acanthaster planci TaxID=133434 RepID=A0A8B7Z1T5_ACAPL|nr:kinesin-like protein KIF6 [Acanthaster planci]
MVKQGIKIFCRIKPTKAKTGLFEIDEDDGGLPKLSIVVPRDLASGFINNKKEEYNFRFDGLFDQYTKQDEIFDNVAKDVVNNCLLGYNGTIFAYGQTGSGKTFTITGGPERYIDRGIIPRMLTYLFEEYAKNPGHVYTTHISYLEIYNESGYDLLDPKHEASKLEDLPKVSLMEDSDGNIHLKNLSIHQASSEEEALNLLFLGDTNRMIAETPMNQASTRSHCIFTIHVSIREAGSATIRRAKLHLVDLAGSERVGKTGVGGTLLTEAKYINLSLHFLEQVIVALSEKSRSHIPYRNSMMTSVLRDSLGGNCMTTMIATCSMEKKNIDESISTCRFAQRVALIKNDAILNEEVDPKLMIARLKGEIQELKNQLALATGEQSMEDLTDEDKERLTELVDGFVRDSDPEATLNVGADMRKINECFRILKRLTQGKGFASSDGSRPEQREDIGDKQQAIDPVTSVDSLPTVNQAEMSKMKELLKQRDNEINILVNMLKKEKKRAQDALSQLHNPGGNHHQELSASSSDQDIPNGYNANISSYKTNSKPQEPHRSHGRSGQGRIQSDEEYRSRDSDRQSVDQSDAMRRSGDRERHKENSSSSYRLKDSKRKILGDMSVGRQEAFEIFRRDYPNNAAIEDMKQQLKQRYTEAKAKGQFVNECRQNINKLKSQIEHRRLQLAMSGEPDPDRPDEVEQSLRQQMEQEKANYKETFTQLRSLKTEIEHLQHFLEKSRLQLQKDFELWWAEQAASLQTQQSLSQPQPPTVPPSNPSKAWRTPPISPLKDQAPDHPSDPQHGAAYTKHDHSMANPASARRPHSGASRNALLGALSAQMDRGSGRHPVVPPLEKLSSSGSVDRTDQEARSSSSRTRSLLDPSSQPAVQLTGDKRADADIMAFIKARQNLLQARGQVPR